MTNNTIPNVPRELLERVLNAGWGSETVNALDDLRDFLASAPSPAGVDGLDVAAWRWKTPIPEELGGSFLWSHASHWSTGPKDAEKLCLLDEALAGYAARDARIVELESQYQRDVNGLNNEGDPIGGDPAGGYANDNARLRAELTNQLEVKAFWIGRTRALEVELAAIKSAQVAKQRLEGLLQRVHVAMSLDDTEWGYSGTEKYTLLADIKAALSTANGEVTK